MSDTEQKSEKIEQNQPIEYLSMMSKSDVVAIVNGLSESFTKDYELNLSVDRSEGNWPSRSMVGEEAEAYDRIHDHANRSAVLKRLGVDKDTPDSYRLVMYSDGVNNVLMSGVIEGSEFVAKARLDLVKKDGDLMTGAIFGMEPDHKPFVNLNREEEVKIPISNTTYDQKARYEHGVEVINLTIEEQKALQADVTLKTPIRENERDPDIRIGVPRASKPESDRKPDHSSGAPNNPKLSKPSIPQDKTFQASVEKQNSLLHESIQQERSALIAAGISGTSDTNGPNGTTQITKTEISSKANGKHV